MYRCHSLFRITNFLFVFLLELLLFFLLFSFSCGNFTYSCCFDALPNLFFAMFFPTIHVYILLPCNTFFFVFFSTIVAMFGVFNLFYFFLKDFKNCFVVEKILVAFSLTLFWYGNLLKFQFLLWKREKEKEISQDDRIVDILLSMNNWRNNPLKEKSL